MHSVFYVFEILVCCTEQHLLTHVCDCDLMHLQRIQLLQHEVCLMCDFVTQAK